MTEPHETDEFRNSTEYTVAITFRVEGGARWQTAHRRAERIAERLASAATRAAKVVEVTARGGVSQDARPLTADRVRFSGANTGHGTYGEPDKLDRYLDPEFERALASLAAANAVAKARTDADRERRRAVGCMNSFRLSWDTPAACLCAYCEPDRHLDTVTGLRSGLQFDPPRCVCGHVVTASGLRCSTHRDHELVVFDDDRDGLHRLAQQLRRSVPEHQPHQDGPDLPPTPA